MLRVATGLAMAGYGLLVLTGVLPHDAPVAGLLALGAGAVLMAKGLPAVAVPRAALTALAGLDIVLALTAYNLWRGSGLGGPELAIVGYGAALMACAPWLPAAGAGHGTAHRVAAAVGWSFAIVLAPLALFALNGALSHGGGGSDAADPIVQAAIVTPTAAGLELSGMPVERVGNTLTLATPRGALSLGVGLVCAGLYPMVLFGGVLALHAWRTRLPPGRLAVLAVAGFGGLWLVNLLRLHILARVGVAKGAAALQQAHAHLGWILFAAFMAVFWALVQRMDGPRPVAGTDT